MTSVKKRLDPFDDDYDHAVGTDEIILFPC